MKIIFVRFLRSMYFFYICFKYRNFTMASFPTIWRNLVIADRGRHLHGCVIECGVWRGGMSAAIAEALGPEREYFLFDSFEGLPPATERDGDEARLYQTNTTSDTYYDNCRAAIEFAELAMQMSGVPKYKIIKGWFDKTVTEFTPPNQIAILRLDGDWYESTLVVLESLYKYLAPDGIVIIDDYYAWDGCSRAVHDFFARHQLNARITQKYGICVIEPRNCLQST